MIDGLKWKKISKYLRCKFKEPCKTKKSSCPYYTKHIHRDTLRTQSVQEKYDDDDYKLQSRQIQLTPPRSRLLPDPKRIPRIHHLKTKNGKSKHHLTRGKYGLNNLNGHDFYRSDTKKS